MIDQQGFLTEGCFSTIFVERGEKLVTPPLSRGLMRGVLRQSLIDMGEAVEGDVRLIDLDNGFLIGNAERGVVAATLVDPHICAVYGASRPLTRARQSRCGKLPCHRRMPPLAASSPPPPPPSPAGHKTYK